MPPLEIRPVDLRDDVALRQAYDVHTRAELLGREDAAHWSWPEFAGSVRKPGPGSHVDLFAGYVDHRMIGTGNTLYGTLDNLDKAWVGAAVDPGERGHGHGRELLEHAAGLAATAGRTVLMAETRIPFDRLPDHPHRRFAEQAGFTLSHAEIVRQLRLPVDDRTITSWVSAAAERSSGYRVETFVDDVPSELLPSLCVLHGQLAVDAPTGDVDWEEEVMTPEMFVESRANLVAQGRTVLETLAITPDGLVAAHSTLMVPPEPRTDASQWGTFVHREHRGHRLGLATKAVNLRALQGSHPRIRRVTTQNAETNRWMIDINEQMGFEPVEASVEFVRRSAR